MDAQSKKHIATSRWMAPDEVEQRFVHQANSFWMGRTATNSEEPVGFSDDRHIMLVSGSRGGKGVSVIVPNLCLWQGSLVVVDPKGENATLTAARRGEGSPNCDGLGQAVHVLDPMNVARVEDNYRASFNPLDALDPTSPHVIDDATRIADAIVEIGQGESRQWDEGARSLVRTLILHVLTHPHYEGRRNLVTVRRLILRGENDMADELRERAKQRGEGGSPSGQVVLWELARRNEALGGVISSTADSFLESAKNSSKQYNSYRLIAERSTEFLDSPGMATCVSSSSFRLADLKTDANGVSVYLALPQRFMSTHYRWLRMMIALTVTEMETVPGQPASGAPVLMVLDEFAGLRRMDIIENGVAQIAGFGVKMFFVLQSLEQLKSVYPDRWETFLANCGVRIFFATTDNFTNQYVSDALGEHEVIRTTRTTGRSTTDSQSSSESFGESISEQSSRAKTYGDSSTTGRGGNNSSSRGGNESRSRGTGTSENDSESFGPEWFFASRTAKQNGKGTSTNRGNARGTNWSDGMGRNWSKSDTRTRSTTTTQGTTSGTSRTSQAGTSQASGRNSGQSEQIFKKALITKDEMAKLFTRIDDPDHRAYPGLALVSIAGEAPMLLRRTPYFADHAFIGLFDPHPDHPIIPLTAKKSINDLHDKKHEWPKRVFNPFYTLPPEAQKNMDSYQAFKQKVPSVSQIIKTSIMINHPIDFVWYALTCTDYYRHWFMIEGTTGPLPDEFYPGYDFKAGYVIDANNNEKLRIFYKSDRNYEFVFSLSKQGSNFTELTLEQIVRTSRLVGFLLFVKGDTSDEKGYRVTQKDVPQINLLKKQLVQFRNMCDDISEGSLPAVDYWHDGYSPWCFNRGPSGVLRFEADHDGFPVFAVGDHIDIDAFQNGTCHIGHIEYQSERDASSQVSNCCWIAISGTITDILKNDGDYVEAGERILRVDPNT